VFVMPATSKARATTASPVHIEGSFSEPQKLSSILTTPGALHSPSDQEPLAQSPEPRIHRMQRGRIHRSPRSGKGRSMSLNEAVTPSRAAPCLPVRAQVGLQDATGARQASRLGSFLRCGSRKTRFPPVRSLPQSDARMYGNVSRRVDWVNYRNSRHVHIRCNAVDAATTRLLRGTQRILRRSAAPAD